MHLFSAADVDVILEGATPAAGGAIDKVQMSMEEQKKDEFRTLDLFSVMSFGKVQCEASTWTREDGHGDGAPWSKETANTFFVEDSIYPTLLRPWLGPASVIFLEVYVSDDRFTNALTAEKRSESQASFLKFLGHSQPPPRSATEGDGHSSQPKSRSLEGASFGEEPAIAGGHASSEDDPEVGVSLRNHHFPQPRTYTDYGGSSDQATIVEEGAPNESHRFVRDRASDLELVSDYYLMHPSKLEPGKLNFSIAVRVQTNKLFFEVLAPLLIANIFVLVLIIRDEVTYDLLAAILFVMVFSKMRPDGVPNPGIDFVDFLNISSMSACVIAEISWFGSVVLILLNLLSLILVEVIGRIDCRAVTEAFDKKGVVNQGSVKAAVMSSGRNWRGMA